MVSGHNMEQMEVWTLGQSPIDLNELHRLLWSYPDKLNADILYDGFSTGFKINYTGPRVAYDSKNLKSVFQNPDLVSKKIQSEIDLGRIAGPFIHRPISNLRCSPIGLIPKKTGGFRLITNLSHPVHNSVNSFIGTEYSTVKYSSFDHAISIIQRLGKGAMIGKMDLKSAFRLLPVYPGCFDLLGFQFNDYYFIDKMMPMGCSESCSYFEKFSTFIEWVVKHETNSEDIDHYLDDFYFAAINENSCKYLMSTFRNVCGRLNVPIAEEKTEGPTFVLEYLGITIDTQKMMIMIPKDKLNDLRQQISYVLGRKKVTLKYLQSLCGLLAFCTKALPAGRAFCRRIYAAMSGVKKRYHKIRVSKDLKADLLVWSEFLAKYNGLSYIHDLNWSTNVDIELYTDSANVGNGCSAYFSGKWTYLPWPSRWNCSEIMRDMTYLELVPIALAIYLWGDQFSNKKILFYSDNAAVVSILNNRSSKSERVMSLLRPIVYFTLTLNFQFKAKHIFSVNNGIADAISRQQVKRFRQLAPSADLYPCAVPQEFWNLLC